MKKGYIMKNLFSKKVINSLIFILSILLIVKIFYLVISYLFLPTSGVDYVVNSKLEPLSYRSRLAFKSKKRPKPKATPKPTPKPVVRISMKGYKLLGILKIGDSATAAVKKGANTSILSIGDNIDGFKLVRVEEDSAIFKKGGQEFKLTIGNMKIENPASAKSLQKFSNALKEMDKREKKRREEKKKDEDEGIEVSEDGAIIERDLLSTYTKDVEKIWKNIGIEEHKKSGKLDGFKVNYVKKGSVFEKLGLRRGDILKAINGRELNNYNTAFNFYRKIDDIDDLTLTIERNNQEMELEYEIH